MLTYSAGARDDKTNRKHTSDIEHEDTNKRRLDSSGNRFPRVLCLAGRNRNQFAANVCKQRSGQRTPESKKDRELLIVHLVDKVAAHGPVWLPPVSESDAIMFWVSSEVDDNAKKNQAHEGYDLQAAHPKLQFSKKLYAKQVHENN
jgi:hypothetical protein